MNDQNKVSTQKQLQKPTKGRLKSKNSFSGGDLFTQLEPQLEVLFTEIKQGRGRLQWQKYSSLNSEFHKSRKGESEILCNTL